MSHTTSAHDVIDDAAQKTLRDDLRRDNLVKFFADVSAQEIETGQAIRLLSERLGPSLLVTLARLLASANKKSTLGF